MLLLGDHLGRGMQAGGMMRYTVKCWECGKEIDNPYLDACPSCNGSLTVEMDLSHLEGTSPKDLRSRPIGVWRYHPFLPIRSEPITLQEGGTPLYDCPKLSEEYDLRQLMVKFEGANPTGSFKDRGMTVGVTRAVELGCKVVGCASTGNTSASLAAYAAKAGLKCVVLLPSGKVALGKLAQAMFFGAKVVTVDGNFDDALRVVKEMSHAGDLYMLNSVNPFRPEGQKTLAFEILDQLDFQMPDRIVYPVGNAANIWAGYKALKEWQSLGWIDELPMLTGVQAGGSAPLVNSFAHGQKDFKPVMDPETVATAIRIGNPASGRKALKAVYDTGGVMTAVSDREIVEAQFLFGRKEGVGVEPASAASLAGVKKLLDEGKISRREKVVCVCTGHVLKDPDTVIKNCGQVLTAKATLEDVRRVISG
ncbi:MAG: threonine synthase [Methanomassiliicoccales archaeon]|nr:threonine synthase [Methanomassiliicoccales archaeon]